MLLIIWGRHLKGESILLNWALKVTKVGKQHEKNRAFCWVWVGERTGEKDEQEDLDWGPFSHGHTPEGRLRGFQWGGAKGKPTPAAAQEISPADHPKR